MGKGTKYFFEKNAFKVSQIFRRHGKLDLYSIQVCFEKNASNSFTNIYNILVSDKEATLQCTYHTSRYQEIEKSQI